MSRPTREAGILLHPTSLPSRYGIGDLGPASDAFLDWASSAGLRLWQVLPLVPPGSHDSPYAGLSAFAGNPHLISPEWLLEEGLLPASALEGAPDFPEDHVDFDAVHPFRERLLRASFDHARSLGASVTDAVGRFEASPVHSAWLPDWALFAALREASGGATWTAWDPALVARDEKALAEARASHPDAIAFHVYVQFLFFRQWERVKRAANARGISILGDLPIYVALDSADVWSQRRLFAVDTAGHPEFVAGVPPDAFATDGQLWGHPLYRWDVLAEENFDWWIERVRVNLRLADLVRLDHFRAFAGYWKIPAGAASAREGHWVTGPGLMLFLAIRHALGDVPIVAEDLGDITDDVRKLVATLGLPGMKVLQFAFGEIDNEHLPHNHVQNCVVYTGTHDNDTTAGWYSAQPDWAQQRFRDYFGVDGRDPAGVLVRAAYSSVADRAIVPLPDVLALGSEARLNVPGRAHDNWTWRAPKDAFRPEVASRLRHLAELTGRLAKTP
ncbi:MAG: 4-alpha-glucanotransferase [Thermoanaerobaculia bacterium]|jgi:4-alpha-glucanotransferase